MPCRAQNLANLEPNNGKNDGHNESAQRQQISEKKNNIKGKVCAPMERDVRSVASETTEADSWAQYGH